MAGWQFETVQSVTVTALGVYDSTGTGLIDSHQVGIWDSGGNLLMFATVPAGTAGTLQNNFWYTPIPIFGLPAGETFTIAAFYGAPDDAIVSAFANVTTDSRISYVDRATSLTTQFSEPINFNNTNPAGDFGPNFTIAGTATPEPATFLLLGLGLITLAVISRRVGRTPSSARSPLAPLSYFNSLSNHSRASL
jgi:hypothetical protein